MTGEEIIMLALAGFMVLTAGLMLGWAIVTKKKDQIPSDFQMIATGVIWLVLICSTAVFLLYQAWIRLEPYS